MPRNEYDLDQLKLDLRRYLKEYCTGKENAKTQSHIAQAMGVHDPRLIRLLCTELDLEDFRVIGDNAGIYTPTDKEGETAYAMTLISQSEKMLIRAKHHLTPLEFASRFTKATKKVWGYNPEEGNSPQRSLFRG